MNELTFKKALYLFESYMKEMNWTGATIKGYQARLHYFFDFLKEKKVSNLKKTKKEHIKEYADYLCTVKGRCTGKKLKQNTRGAYLKTVLRFFRFLLRGDHIREDITSGITVKDMQLKEFPDYLTEKQAEDLLKQPDTGTVLGFRDRTMLEVLYGTGLRKSELRNLKVHDVNFDEQVFFINQGKGMKDRIIPFGDVAGYFLKKYISGPRRELLLLGYMENTLFLSCRGRKLSSMTVNKILDKYLQKLGIKNRITVHSLRHSFAVHMLTNGTDIRYIQEMLGHSSFHTSYQYTRVQIDYLKKMYSQYHPFENQLYEDAIKENEKYLKAITSEK
jgi:site-specific recombinase XerD